MGNLAPPQHNRDFRANRLSEDTVARNAALRDRIRAAHRVMSAAMAEILDAAAEADETESYWADGAQTTDEWLVGNLGVRSFTARRWAKLARSLRDFPHLRMSMRDGELSIDQAYELVKFLEPDQGPEFMTELRHDYPARIGSPTQESSFPRWLGHRNP